MNFLLAKKDLLSYSTSDILKLAQYLHIDQDYSLNDIAWLITLNLHIHNASMLKGNQFVIISQLDNLLKIAAERGDKQFIMSEPFISELQHLSTEQLAYNKNVKNLDKETKITRGTLLTNESKRIEQEYPTDWAVFKLLQTTLTNVPAPLEWVINSYISGATNKLEDLASRLTPAIKTFEKIKIQHSLSQTLADFKGLRDLEDFNEQYSVQEKIIDKGKSKELYNGKTIRIIRPLNQTAACYYGAGTRWCTAARENNLFAQYNDDGPLYIIIPKNASYVNEKYQLHMEKEQFMDRTDTPVNLNELFIKYPEIQTAMLSLVKKNTINMIIFKDTIDNILNKNDEDEDEDEDEDSRKQFLLVWGSRFGYNKLVEYLLKAGIDPNKPDNDGELALVEAAMNVRHYSTLETVKILLHNGADPNIKDELGEFPLIRAASYSGKSSTEETVQLLLDNEADVDMQNENGEDTSLSLALARVNHGSTVNTVKMLLDAGANINITNSSKIPLIIASIRHVDKNGIDAIKLLLKYGADPNAVASRYGSALAVAEKIKDPSVAVKVIKLLLKYKVNIKTAKKLLSKSTRPEINQILTTL